MADDVFFPLPDEGGKLPEPGSFSVRDGEKYITCVYIEPGKILALPSGRTITHMRIFIDECLTKLYIKAKARDN